MRFYAGCTTLASFLLLSAFVACGSESTVAPEDLDGGATDDGGLDPKADAGGDVTDGSTFDVVLYEAGAPCNGDPACDRRIAFITKNGYDADFGGLSDADAVCMTEAAASPLLAGRTFRAWLSINAISAASRLPAFTASLRRVDGEIVANGMTELLTTGPKIPINKPPSSATAISALVWTGTRLDGGSAPNLNCSGWDDTTGMGGVGKSDDVTAWTSTSPNRPCAVPLHLYCIED